MSEAAPVAKVARYLVPAGFVAAALLLGFGQRPVRIAEAGMAGWVATVSGFNSVTHLGSSVVFQSDGHWVGFTLTAGCTVALLAAPVLVIAALVSMTGRLSTVRLVVSALVACAALVIVNQLRLLVVGASIRGWGFADGYERSHLLLSPIVSTLGVVASIVVFVRVAVSGDRHA